jgi:hypothetical protein
MIFLCIYLWLLLTFSVVFFMEQVGTPYSPLELTIRAVLLPITFPFYFISGVIKRCRKG